MNEIFKPSLVISVGPSAKKALDFLENMLLDVPEYLKNVIEFYNIDNVENFKDDIQGIIDNKLLCAKSINKLVDLGYKIRTENTANININIFLYWDVYGIGIDIENITKILFDLNYCVVDKEKHFGVTLFLLPMLDKEWLYDEKDVALGIDNLRKIVDFISVQKNMINIDSKMYITHTVANDGLRISKDELQYILSIITYLTILPSEEPLLSVYNKRVLKSEEKFKVGAIGISSLTIFKDKIKEEFSAYLCNDLINHCINFEDDVNFCIYSSNDILKNRRVGKYLNESFYIDKNNKLVIPEEDKLIINNEKIWRRRSKKYIEVIEEFEKNIRIKFTNNIKKEVDENAANLYKKFKLNIDSDLNSIINRYSLKEGENFLSYLYNKVDNEIKSNTYINESEILESSKEELIDRVKSHPDFLEFWSKIIFIMTFIIYFLIFLMNKISFMETDFKIFIFVLLIVSTLLFTLIEYVFVEKQFERFIDKYIDDIYLREGLVLKKYIVDSVSNYYEGAKEYINLRMQDIILCRENLLKIRMNIEGFKDREEEDIEILITDLFNYKDRRYFYEENKEDLGLIYSRFISNLENIEELKSKEIKNKVNVFCENVTEEYINKDIYEYARIKWKSNFEKEVGKWIDKSLIKSKELLQYNSDNILEEHKVFIGSGEFINESKNIIIDKLDNCKKIPIKGENIYTNCIAIVNLILGINLDKISSFTNLKRRSEE